MPEHIRALIIVLVLGTLVWSLSRPAIVQIISPQAFSRWRKLWYVTTLAWFLAHSFWIYVCIMVVMLLTAGRRETYVLGLYLLLLMAAPSTGAPIPGLGVIDHIFVLDHYRLLALFLLLPFALRLSRRSTTVRLFRSPVDWMVMGYLVLNTVLAFRGGNFTNDARAALMLWIDLFLPYYVASRSLQTREDFRHALVGLALGGILFSAFAAMEVLRSWKLYEAASAALGLNTFGAYKTRGPWIRPAVTVIESIALGYAIVVAAGGYLYLQGLIKGSGKRWMGWLVLSVGILASLSRGPWLGAVLMLFVFVLASPKPFKRLMVSSVVALCVILGLSVSPFGQQIIGLLPFVGDAEQGNVDYRADLLTVSMAVIERNPLLGASDFMDAPELEVMRQGEGIIDIVNSYLAVILYAGFVGLFFFVGMFLSALMVLRRGMRRAREANDPDRLALGVALFAAMVGTIFIILTVSSVTIVPTLYIVLVGIACAYFLVNQVEDTRKRLGAT